MKNIVKLALAASIALQGCSHQPRQCKDPNLCTAVPEYHYSGNVSDVPAEKSIQGVTYDKGPAHPTFWEWAFDKLGIK